MAHGFNEHKADILFHQPVIDYFDTSATPYQNFVTPETDLATPRTLEEELALNACKQAVSLKEAAGTKLDRAIDLAHLDQTQHLTADRQPTLAMTRELSRLASKSGVRVGWHVLADVHDSRARGLSLYAMPALKGKEANVTFLRLEEALVLPAERVAQSVSAALATGMRPKSNRQLTLHGYRFNRNQSMEQPVIDMPEMPSCAAFMAATILEQTSLSPAVVRVLPYWMKDREMAARETLRLAGHADLPVISAIVGESGDLEKIIRWSSKLPPELQRLVPAFNERLAHRQSTHLTKQLHDTIASHHSRLFKQFCYPELESNLKPSSIIQYPLLTIRAREYLSRTLPAAIIYEKSKIGSDSTKETLNDIRIMAELFGANYQRTPLANAAKPVSIQRRKGSRTNDVSYVHAILAVHPEQDPAALTYSKQIDLIGHFIIESLPPELRKQLINGDMTSQKLTDLFELSPPRSVLLEARRSGPGLERSQPFGIGNI